MTHHHTYDEWKSAGYQVVKGAKAVGRDINGVAMFSPEQVKPITLPDEDYEQEPGDMLQYAYDDYIQDMGDR